MFSWSPRRYCRYAVTNRPDSVTGISPKTIPERSGSTINPPYATNEFRSPTRKTSRIHVLTPEKTKPFDVVQPSGDAKITGTPTIIRNERAIRQKTASWKNRSIYRENYRDDPRPVYEP
jgi:hypothetical protein